MRYQKPEIVVLGPAARVIGSRQSIKGLILIESGVTRPRNSTGAYETDE
jgi:hypothetical protein